MHTPPPTVDDAAPAKDTGLYKWAVVGMLWFICFFNYADRQAITSVFPKLHEEFGFDKVQLGLIGSAFMWIYAGGAPFAGFIADRVKRKHLILGGCLFWSFVTILTGWCSTLWHFVTVRALEGFGETFYFPASMSLTADYHSKRTRSRAMSIHQTSVYAGSIAGSWFAAWAAEHYGWRLGFYVFGGAGMLLAFLLYLFLVEPRRGAADLVAPAAPAPAAAAPAEKPAFSFAELFKTWAIILRKPTAVILMLAFLGANFVATIFLTWTPTFLTEKFGFKLAAAGLSGALFINVASAFSAPLGGVLADLTARRHPGGRMLVQAGGLLVGATFVTFVGTTNDKTMLLVWMSLFGFCKGIYDSNIFASLYDAIEPQHRASAAGLMNTIGWGGGALGPLFVGIATKYGPHEKEIDNMSEAIAWTGAIYLVCTVLLLFAALVFAKRDVIKTAEPQTA